MPYCFYKIYAFILIKTLNKPIIFEIAFIVTYKCKLNLKVVSGKTEILLYQKKNNNFIRSLYCKINNCFIKSIN